MHYPIDSSSVSPYNKYTPLKYSSQGGYSPQWSEISYGSSSSSSSSSSSGVYSPRTPHLHTVPLPPPGTMPVLRSAVPHISHPNQHQPPSVISLNPVLSYDPNTRLLFNVSRDMSYIQLRPGCPPSTLQEPALYPTVTQMLIILPYLPQWSIRVTNPRGITANDVLFQIHEALNHIVSQNEVNALDGATKATGTETFKARSRGSHIVYSQGIKRVDFLGRKNVFAGLTRARDGHDHWDIHFIASA